MYCYRLFVGPLGQGRHAARSRCCLQTEMREEWRVPGGLAEMPDRSFMFDETTLCSYDLADHIQRQSAVVIRHARNHPAYIIDNLVVDDELDRAKVFIGGEKSAIGKNSKARQRSQEGMGGFLGSSLLVRLARLS